MNRPFDPEIPIDETVDARRDDVNEVVAYEERLVAGTNRVDSGRRVRLSKRIISEERTITVTVSREELVVEHVDEDGRAVEAPVPAAAGDHYRSKTPAGELVLREEVVEVVKSVRPVERVRVYVDTTTEAREVTDTIAREVIDVEGDGVEPIR